MGLPCYRQIWEGMNRFQAEVTTEINNNQNDNSDSSNNSKNNDGKNHYNIHLNDTSPGNRATERHSWYTPDVTCNVLLSCISRKDEVGF